MHLRQQTPRGHPGAARGGASAHLDAGLTTTLSAEERTESGSCQGSLRRRAG
jgi:hypothetical protein